MKKKKLIVVLGMHRSGTSTVTRALKVMGVDLGDKMMPPAEGNNPKGFWEDLDINALNIEMMHALNSDWHYLAFLETADVEILRSKGFFSRAVDLIRKKIGRSPSFGFKDPRLAKLLPFWREVLNHCQFDISYILAIRHPLSVVRSLAKRDSIEEAKSYFLWLGHVIASLLGSSGKNRVLVDYDLLMQSPDHELERIARNLDLEINDAELQSYKTEFLDHSLRHTIYQLNDLMLDDACPPLAYEIYTKLLEVAKDQSQVDTPAFQEKIEQWATEFVRIKSVLQLADRLCRQREATVQSLTECEGQIANLNQDGAERGAELDTCRIQANEFARHTAALQKNLLSAQEAIAGRDKELDTCRIQAEESAGRIAVLQAWLSEARTEVACLTSTMRESEAQMTRELSSWKFLTKRMATLFGDAVRCDRKSTDR